MEAAKKADEYQMVDRSCGDDNGVVSPYFFQPEKVQVKKPFALKKKSDIVSTFSPGGQESPFYEGADYERGTSLENQNEVTSPSPELL